MTELRGTMERNAAMSDYTSWRVGGPADTLYKPADCGDLCAFLESLPAEEPVQVIGLGSNLLVRDGGVRGTVIHLHGALRSLRYEDRRAVQREAVPRFGMVYAEAGVASPKLARFAASQDLTGAEFLAGIPGTIGGALAMNAGCYGHETWSYVTQVMTVDRHGETHKRTPREYRIAYRKVEAAEAEQEWFLAAWFLFPKGDGEVARIEIKRLLERRLASQPLELPNAGSVFRNPSGDFAARLIEACGMKGARIGDAQVSEKHANFIVNLGQATAAGIEALIERVQAQVKEKTGVELVREVRILGDHVAPALCPAGTVSPGALPASAVSSGALPAESKDAGKDAGATGDAA
jgi:UDP-N-acetylmuramate dehydrogenase